jgi:lysozyme family protein
MRQGAQMQAPEQPKVVDRELAGMAQPMPEDTGIAQLPAPNMERMAEGGIVAFEGGGSTSQYSDAFERAFAKVLKFEGKKYVADDAGKGPTKFGINKTANPDVDVANLTLDEAKQIYKKRYWDRIGGDAIAATNPQLATIAFDAAVNQGVKPALNMLDKSGGEPNKLLALRQQRYIDLAANDPSKKQFLGGWTNRVASLQSDLQADKDRLPMTPPGAEAQAAAAPADDMSFWDKRKKEIVGVGTILGSPLAGGVEALRQGMNMGPLNDVLRSSTRAAIAAPGAFVPAYTGLGGAALSTGAANALSNATPEQLDQMEGFGADPSGTSLAAAIMNAPNRPPEKPAMSYGDQMANIAKTIVSAPDRPRKPEPAPEPVVEPVEKGGMPDLNQAFRQFELAQQNKTEDVQVAAPKPEDEGIAKLMPEEPKKNETDWGNLALMFGLNLLAGDSPNALTNVGKAGLNTLAMQQAEAKAKAERETKLSETDYRKAMAKYYEESAGAIARGAKEKNNVQMAEQAAVNAAKAWADANKMALLQTPGLFDQKLREFRMEAYKNFGIEPTMTASAPDAIGGGFKLLGVRPS